MYSPGRSSIFTKLGTIFNWRNNWFLCCRSAFLCSGFLHWSLFSPECFPFVLQSSSFHRMLMIHSQVSSSSTTYIDLCVSYLWQICTSVFRFFLEHSWFISWIFSSHLLLLKNVVALYTSLFLFSPEYSSLVHQHFILSSMQLVYLLALFSASKNK